jgi:hypothetical protein
VGTEQRENLDAILRQSVFPADVTVTAATLGGVRTAEITIDGIQPRHVALYFHGGVELELETAGAVTLTVCDVVDRPVVAA